MSDNTTITFEWRERTYSVPEGRNPILVETTGEVLSGDGWQFEIFPPKPGNLKLLYKVVITAKTDLAQLAKTLNAVLATEVLITYDTICPRGCVNPTRPYCSQCGSMIQISKTVIPYHTMPPATLDIPVDVIGTGPCPHCGQVLDHNHQIKKCPGCSQALHWICR